MKRLLLLLFISSTLIAQEESYTTDFVQSPSDNISRYEEMTDADKLFESIRLNDTDMIKGLLNSGVDPNSRDSFYRTPLMYATDKSLESAELLLAHDAYVNTRDSSGNTTLIIASEKGYVYLVQLLLRHSASVNLENRAGLTAFHFAVQNGHTEIVKLLAENGAKIFTLFPHGVPPIFEAVKNGYTSIASHLIDLGINPNSVVDKTGTSLLSIASAYGSVTMVEMLLKKGADPNLPNKLGVTPIFMSIGKGHVKITSILLENGASTKAKTTEGLTPKDVTVDRATLKLLQKYK